MTNLVEKGKNNIVKVGNPSKNGIFKKRRGKKERRKSSHLVSKIVRNGK